MYTMPFADYFEAVPDATVEALPVLLRGLHRPLPPTAVLLPGRRAWGYLQHLGERRLHRPVWVEVNGRGEIFAYYDPGEVCDSAG